MKETKEVLAYAKAIAQQLELSYADGYISTAEIIKGILTTLPDGIRAISGANKIGEELKNLSDEEKSELIKELIDTIIQIVSVFVPVKEK